ncbi:hypothetical protein HQ393_01140 [Chitinibacter bivalviorum]|uniref:Secretin n=1 Tax=Chitinibacter bivalviorum TaxID=2739434 RepID=A0A7H9BFE5_9NEIS|nr:hypothetical protein [Chitinibacter bivalviorum]QLG86956.1 hypothetical protein HQ393_01140 [Chitinibacter bivalviorum]
MSSLLNIVLAAILLVGMFSSAFADVVDSFAPKHKLATQLALVLQEAFPKASIRAFSGQLVVSAPDQAVFAQIRAMADQLDTPTRSLRISVEQRDSSQRNAQSLDANGAVIVSNQGSRAAISVTAGEGQSQRTQTQQQMLTVLDGAQAMIMLGQQRFIPMIGFRYRPGYTIVQHGGAWQSAGSGFYVAPALLGDGRVSLKIAPQSSSFNRDGSLDLHATYSEVEGRLGEWLPIGQTKMEGSNDRRRIYEVDEQQVQTSYTVWVKVELSR